MECCRKLRVTLVSAENLPNFRRMGRMKVYAMASLNGESQTAMCTNVNNEGGTNPRWNFPIEYMISESKVEQPGMNLVVKLFCRRTLGDRLIGVVEVPVKGLFDMGLVPENILSYKVSGTRDGTLQLSYGFGERVLVQVKDSKWKGVLVAGFVVGFVAGFVALVGVQSNCIWRF